MWTFCPDAYLQSFDHFVGGDLVGNFLYPRRVSNLPVCTHDATEGSWRLGLRGEVHPGGQLFFQSPLPASIGQKTKVQREKGDFVTSFFISKISNLQRALSPGRPGTRLRPRHPLLPRAWTLAAASTHASPACPGPTRLSGPRRCGHGKSRGRVSYSAFHNEIHP